MNADQKDDSVVEVWAISLNDDCGFYGEYPGRNEAIEAGAQEFNCEPFYVGKCRHPAPLHTGIDGQTLIENALECLEHDYYIDTPAAENWKPTKAQYKDLEARLAPVIEAWLKENELKPQWFLVDAVEHIEPDFLSWS